METTFKFNSPSHQLEVSYSVLPKYLKVSFSFFQSKVVLFWNKVWKPQKLGLLVNDLNQGSSAFFSSKPVRPLPFDRKDRCEFTTAKKNTSLQSVASFEGKSAIWCLRITFSLNFISPERKISASLSDRDDHFNQDRLDSANSPAHLHPSSKASNYARSVRPTTTGVIGSVEADRQLRRQIRIRGPYARDPAQSAISARLD